jgi:Zn-dependent M28 family amino/carboxypeptidase
MHRDSGVASSYHPDAPAVLVGPAALSALETADAMVEVRVAFDRRPVRAENVACLLPGTDPGRRDTVVAFTAHYDHLGVSVPDAAQDSIYNGFSDDAAGVAMLLSIAEALRRSPAGGLPYGALFLFFTGEERGLFGSDYFVARPAWPLARIRAVINLDAGAPPAPPWAWRVAGGEDTPLGALARDVAAERGWGVTLSPATPNSDYFPFARMGVPAVFLIPGSAPYEGLSADSSQALRRRWDRYHQPADAYDDAFPFRGLQRYAEFALRLAEALDGRPRRPPPGR